MNNMNTAQLGFDFKPFSLSGLVLRLHTEKEFPTLPEYETTDVDMLVGFYRNDETDILVYYIILNGETFRGIVTDQDIMTALTKEQLISVLMQRELAFGGDGFKMPSSAFTSEIKKFRYKMSVNKDITAKAALQYMAKVSTMTANLELEFAKHNLLPH